MAAKCIKAMFDQNKNKNQEILYAHKIWNSLDFMANNDLFKQLRQEEK